MNESKIAEVTGPDGLHGTVDATPCADGHVLIRLDDGGQLRVPASVLERRPGERGYYLPLGRAALGLAASSEHAVVPVVEEEVRFGTRQVETGRVRVRKLVREEEETFDEPLAREEVTVERVAVEKFVDGPQPMRREGDVVVIPIVEEVLVVEKRLMLKEELRVRKRIVEERSPQTVTLRREEAVVERLPAPGAADEKSMKVRPDVPPGTRVAKPTPADRPDVV